MSEANKRTAIRFIEAMSAGDATGQAECLASNAFTITKGHAQVSGTRNRDTMLATVEAFRDVVPGGFNPRVQKVVAEGDTVVVEWQGDAVLSDGTPYANEYVFIFTFDNGLIRQLNEYFCTVHADSTILPLLAAKSAAMAHGN